MIVVTRIEWRRLSLTCSYSYSWSIRTSSIHSSLLDLPSLTHLAWDSRIFDESHALTPHSGNLTHFLAQRKTIFLLSQVLPTTLGGANPPRNLPSIRTVTDNSAAMRPLCRIALDTSIKTDIVYVLCWTCRLTADRLMLLDGRTPSERTFTGHWRRYTTK